VSEVRRRKERMKREDREKGEVEERNIQPYYKFPVTDGVHRSERTEATPS